MYNPMGIINFAAELDFVLALHINLFFAPTSRHWFHNQKNWLISIRRAANIFTQRNNFPKIHVEAPKPTLKPSLDRSCMIDDI